VVQLRRAADAIETAVIGDWLERDRVEPTRQLEQAYRRIVRDKNRYEAVYKCPEPTIRSTHRVRESSNPCWSSAGNWVSRSGSGPS
jgi:hypothetical protein